MNKWFENAIFYHIYPLGFCGAEEINDFSGEISHNITVLSQYAKHIAQIGCNALYLGPVFESSAHGYDTADYKVCDRRLGDNDDLKAVVNAMHENGIKVIFDGVFNHVGRDFWAFKDVRENKFDSRYKDWFQISFEGNSGYNDGFWYEGWEGHFELVKLNLHNPEVKAHIFDCVKYWIENFDIDGIRLDVAYCLPHDFLREIRNITSNLKPDFFLLGEVLHGDYSQYCKPDMLDSVTNYECYKGLHSSVNSRNMHEIGYSLNRQFGPEHWTIYKGLHLFSFLDNHDVTRIASIIDEKNNIAPLYALMFAMPSIPCIYYGSEWGILGEKSNGDRDLRPSIDVNNIPWNDLSDYIAKIADIYKVSPALSNGNYRPIYTQPCQLIFEREFNGETIIAAFNFDSNPHTANISFNGTGFDILSGNNIQINGSIELAAHSAVFIKV